MKLTDLELKILKILIAHDELHGCDIIGESGGNIPVGSMHTTLNRMKEKGLVKKRKPKNRSRVVWSATASAKRIDILRSVVELAEID